MLYEHILPCMVIYVHIHDHTRPYMNIIYAHMATYVHNMATDFYSVLKSVWSKGGVQRGDFGRPAGTPN